MSRRSSVNSASPAQQPQPASCFDSFTGMIFRNELFAYQPVPRFHQGQFGSGVGVFCTILVMLGMAGYISISMVRFLEDNVSISLESTLSPERGMPMIPFQLSLPHIGDPTYFEVLVQHRYSPAPGERTQKQVIPTDALDVNSTVVDPVSFNMTGNCQVEECHYIRIKVFPCENGTTVLPNGTVCRPAEEINDVVQRHYLDLTLTTQIRGKDVPYTSQTSLKFPVSFRKQLLFDIKEVVRHPNYYDTFFQEKFVELQLSRETFDIDRIPRLEAGEDRELAKIDFSLSSTVIRENINPQTLLDLFGSWAAFFGALMAVFRILAHKIYNKERFYKEHPLWTNFQDDFSRKEDPIAAAIAEVLHNQRTGEHSPMSAEHHNHHYHGDGKDGDEAALAVGTAGPIDEAVLAHHLSTRDSDGGHDVDHNKPSEVHRGTNIVVPTIGSHEAAPPMEDEEEVPQPLPALTFVPSNQDTPTRRVVASAHGVRAVDPADIALLVTPPRDPTVQSASANTPSPSAVNPNRNQAGSGRYDGRPISLRRRSDESLDPDDDIFRRPPKSYFVKKTLSPRLEDSSEEGEHTTAVKVAPERTSRTRQTSAIPLSNVSEHRNVVQERDPTNASSVRSTPKTRSSKQRRGSEDAGSSTGKHRGRWQM